MLPVESPFYLSNRELTTIYNVVYGIGGLNEVTNKNLGLFKRHSDPPKCNVNDGTRTFGKHNRELS
jgi:hypothetical protein